jgi:hypothetical protein
MFRVDRNQESGAVRSNRRGYSSHSHLAALFSIRTCVAMLTLTVAKPSMGLEKGLFRHESGLVMPRVVEPASTTSSEIPQNSGTRLEGLPPSQSVVPAIVTADSKPIRSGRAQRWSPWHRIEVGKAPAGYALQRVEFWITGDGKCGSTAECKEIIQGNSRVVWKFRIRSQSDVKSGSGGYSVAHLRVFYRAQD